MKITHCILDIDKTSGGPSRSLPNLCKMLTYENESISLVCYKTPNINLSALQENGVDLRLIDIEKTIIERLRSRFYIKAINEIYPDVLHGHNLWSPCLHNMAVYARKNKILYILSPRGSLEPWSLQQSPLKKELALKLYQKTDLRKAACIHVTSEMEADNIRKLGVKTPLAIIPNGINVEYYQEKNYNLQKEKKQKTVLFISRIHPKKGIHLLIEAWNRLPNDLRTSWNLEIIGTPDDADYMERIRCRCQECNLINSIFFLDPVFGKEKIEKYQSANLFVLPTYSENFGMVIAESLACGTPVITTTGTPWESLNTHGCGWWIDLDVESLCQTLQMAMSTPQEDLVTMGKKGRILVEQTCSLDIVAKQYVQMYQWILNKIDKPKFVVL